MKSLIALPIVALTMLFAGAAAADPPRPDLDTLLPDTTCEYVTIPDLHRWNEERFRRFGVFLEHSAAQPYLRDTEPRWVRLYELPAALGVTWDALRAAAGGPAGRAVVGPPGGNRGAWALLPRSPGQAPRRPGRRAQPAPPGQTGRRRAGQWPAG